MGSMLEHQSQFDADFVNEVSEAIKTLGHPDRIRIVEYIRDGEKSVNQISDWCKLSQPITSQHLRLMRDKGIVNCRRDGNKMLYSLPNQLAHKMLDCLSSMQEQIKLR